jgi:hypothetical protein
MTPQLPVLGALDSAGPKFWRTGIAFLAVYLALNLMTKRFDPDRLGITVWSPDNGLSLVLLIESITFAPFVFAGAVLVDIFVARVQHSAYVTMTSELVLVIVYASLALFIRKRLKFTPRRIRLADAAPVLIFFQPQRRYHHLYIVQFFICTTCFHPISWLS